MHKKGKAPHLKKLHKSSAFITQRNLSLSLWIIKYSAEWRIRFEIKSYHYAQIKQKIKTYISWDT